jgi:hypothetical protein
MARDGRESPLKYTPAGGDGDEDDARDGRESPLKYTPGKPGGMSIPG